MSKKKNVSQAELRKLMSGKLTKKPTKRAPAKVTTTEDLIALKKIKLLQEGKLNTAKKQAPSSSLINKINHNADKLGAKAAKRSTPLNDDDEQQTAVPAGFFDDRKEEAQKMTQIGFKKPAQEGEKINPRLLNQKKDGPRIKGVGVATSLPAGFYDDATKDANIRGVETPADKEKREWNEFTEAMNEEVVKSNQMLEQEDEYGNLARDIAEVDQQIAQFGKIKSLADKAGELRETRHQLREQAQTKEDVEMSDGDSDEEIDWRQQNIF